MRWWKFGQFFHFMISISIEKSVSEVRNEEKKPRNKILIFPGKSGFAKYWSVCSWSLHKSPLNGFFGFSYFLTNPFTDIAKDFSACAKYQKKFERNSKFSSTPFINWILFGYPSWLIMSYTPVFLQKSFQRDIAEPKNAAISYMYKYNVCINSVLVY